MVDSEILTGEDLQVARWRHERLTELGVGEDDADWLAHGDTDWHRLEALVAAGCPVDTAVRILA